MSSFCTKLIKFVNSYFLHVFLSFHYNVLKYKSIIHSSVQYSHIKIASQIHVTYIVYMLVPCLTLLLAACVLRFAYLTLLQVHLLYSSVILCLLFILFCCSFGAISSSTNGLILTLHSGTSLDRLGDHMWWWESNLDWPDAGQLIALSTILKLQPLFCIYSYLGGCILSTSIKILYLSSFANLIPSLPSFL